MIRNIFQDMVDEKLGYFHEKDGVITIEVSLHPSEEGNIDQYFKAFEENIKVIDEFKVAYDRLKEEYPNLPAYFHEYSSNLHLKIRIGFKEGSFYQIRGNDVRIVSSRFKKVVGGNYNLHMSRTYSTFEGEYPSGQIDSDIRYRGNSTEVQRITDVINNLEIEGEKLVVGRAQYYSNPGRKTDCIGISFRANPKFTYIND